MATATTGGTVARNYAEALLALAQKAGDASGWGALLGQLAGAIDVDTTLQRYLASPKIRGANKAAMLTRALTDRVPAPFVRWLQALVKNRRQALIPAIAAEYEQLLDAVEGRVHARVTVARETDAADATMIAQQLSKAMGKTVVPTLTVNPAILGGVIVRIGDTVMDGSVRRKLAMLRSRMTA
ncbi:MAG: F0F1 ATP synthase subunit delta [Gemmatimonadaceae bacterium]|jgi:F-type H+-transporting ATPase subunit delta|nr:F0F1 ATP synthase subunit delta [Gemmatimonadaceae bacterium]